MPAKKMDGNSFDIQQQLLGLLQNQAPQIFTEGKIDPAKLAATLGQDISCDKERYGLSWAGKTDCFKHIQEPTTATLKPLRKESADFDTTQNLFIEGDNLQVLKVLQKSYYGKVKMIYIDPPYNTGNDSFIYPDKFSETQDEYLKRIGDKDAEGNLIRDGFWRKNSKDAGHFHSNWLSMMYPRLFLARNLLRPDGVIFVSIDDNEVHNLRMIMNEVFGEDNFYSQVIVRSNSRGQTYNQIAKTHEYLFVFTKNNDVELSELQKEGDKDDLNLKDDIGAFNIRELRNRNPKFGKHNRPNLFYPIYVNSNLENSDGFFPISIKKEKGYDIKIEPFNSQREESCWRWGKELAERNIKSDTLNSNLIARKKQDGGFAIYEKYRKSTYKPKSIWDDNGFLNETGTVELRKLELNDCFDFPKPVFLIKQCIELACTNDDIVLDFFAGSCTTAHAVMQLNAEDGGNRKFICVQLPEPCDKDSEAAKAGFATIADIGKERIRRAAKKIRKETDDRIAHYTKNPELFKDDNQQSTLDNLKSLDFGFKVFKLDESNFKEWRKTIKTPEELKKQMELFVNNVKDGTKQEDILYELILKAGLDLNVSVETKKAHGKTYYALDGGKLTLCLEEKITQGLVDKILAEKPEKVVCLDRAFAGNDQLKTNTALQMEAEKVEFKVI